MSNSNTLKAKREAAQKILDEIKDTSLRVDAIHKSIQTVYEGLTKQPM